MQNKKKRLSIIILITVVMFFGIISRCEKKEAKTTSLLLQDESTEKFYGRPIADLGISFQSFDIKPNEAVKLTTKEGSQIRIPKDAFLDKDGKVILDNVIINYREFRNPLDFYIEGIPMEYEENGETKVFISAGMFEINATTKKTNEKVFVNPANKIVVDLVSTTKSQDFNVYDLDTKTQKWGLKRKDSIRIVNKKDEIDALHIPEAPRKAEPAAFSITDDTGLFPEIGEYENVKFMPIDVTKCNISNAQEIKVIPRKHGLYEVVSIIKIGSMRKEKSCLCYLVFEEGKDYNNALMWYQKKYGNLLKEKEKMLQQWKNYGVELEKYHISKVNLDEKIIRTLGVNQFGIVNLDYPSSYPVGVTLRPNFIDSKGRKLQLRNVVLIEKGTNAIYRYSDAIKFNPKKVNFLCGITPDNKLAYIKNGALSKYTNSSKVIVMNIYEGKLSNYDEVYKFIFK